MSQVAPRMKFSIAVPLVACAMLALLFLVAGLGSGDTRESPDIIFNDARLVTEGERLYLDAQADIVLPQEVQRGLDSGVPLEFVVKLTLSEPRSLWLDKRVLTERWRYRLNYYELTRHYRINALDGTGSRNYRSLRRALDGLGSLRTPVSSPSTDNTIATLRIQLDSTRLPLPLRPILGNLFGSRFGGNWAVRGEPYRWAIELAESSSQGRS